MTPPRTSRLRLTRFIAFGALVILLGLVGYSFAIQEHATWIGVLVTAFWLLIIVGFVVRLVRGRTVTDAASPAAGAADVLRDVYAGRGTTRISPPLFGTETPTSETVDRLPEDPLDGYVRRID